MNYINYNTVLYLTYKIPNSLIIKLLFLIKASGYIDIIKVFIKVIKVSGFKLVNISILKSSFLSLLFF